MHGSDVRLGRVILDLAAKTPVVFDKSVSAISVILIFDGFSFWL
jgi:hypothetical protein